MDKQFWIYHDFNQQLWWIDQCLSYCNFTSHMVFNIYDKLSDMLSHKQPKQLYFKLDRKHTLLFNIESKWIYFFISRYIYHHSIRNDCHWPIVQLWNVNDSNTVCVRNRGVLASSGEHILSVFWKPIELLDGQPEHHAYPIGRCIGYRVRRNILNTDL